MSKEAPKPVAQKKNAAKTNLKKGSLVKVVVLDDKGKWLRPEKGSIHYIDEDAKLPEITFEIETAQQEPYTLTWQIHWDAKVSGLRESAKRGKLLKTFNARGEANINGKTWTVDLNNQILGGLLTVKVKAGEELFKRSIYIRGKNPSAQKLKDYISTLDNAKGFEKILLHEALGKNFINADGEPVVAFDKGYGLSQLTNPAPTFEQIWNWKKNVDAGIKLYRQKRAEAEHDLEKKGKDSYTEEQLQIETFTRYNGGKYHEWDNAEKKWARKKNVLCDDTTGNIGWDISEEVNKGKTQSELNARDKDMYKKGKTGQTQENKWIYTGVCYADHVKNK